MQAENALRMTAALQATDRLFPGLQDGRVQTEHLSATREIVFFKNKRYNDVPSGLWEMTGVVPQFFALFHSGRRT